MEYIRASECHPHTQVGIHLAEIAAQHGITAGISSSAGGEGVAKRLHTGLLAAALQGLK